MTEHIIYIWSGEKRGPLYVGVCRQLEMTLRRHRAGKPSRPEFRLDRLVYTESFSCKFKADKRRRALKAASQEWTNALISAHNPAWQDLSMPSIEMSKAA